MEVRVGDYFKYIRDPRYSTIYVITAIDTPYQHNVRYNCRCRGITAAVAGDDCPWEAKLFLDTEVWKYLGNNAKLVRILYGK